MNKKKIDAKNEINASGLIIAPGFIDAHTHDDFFLLTNPSIYYKLEQGVTTSISGNCGIGLFPLNDLLVEEYRNMLAGVPEGDKIIEIAKNFTDFEHFRDPTGEIISLADIERIVQKSSFFKYSCCY